MCTENLSVFLQNEIGESRALQNNNIHMGHNPNARSKCTYHALQKERPKWLKELQICLPCLAYKPLSAVIAKILSVPGFRPARDTRDNVCFLEWTINMLVKEDKPGVVIWLSGKLPYDCQKITQNLTYFFKKITQNLTFFSKKLPYAYRSLYKRNMP